MRVHLGFLALFVIACGGSAPPPNSPSSMTSANEHANAGHSNEVSQLDCGDFHNCARMGDGTVRCWGRNRDGELGDGGASKDATRPTLVEGVRDVEEVAVGSNFSCARFRDGTVRCWGSGKILGDGREVDKQKPTEVTGVRDAVELDAGGYVACVRTQSGAAKCWGLEAVDGGGPASGVLRVSGAGAHACVLMTDGGVRCWGEGAWSPGAKGSFANPGISAALAISSGDSFACALGATGSVSCFGRNEQGELGSNPDEDNHPKPIAVRNIRGASAIASAESHSCAVLSDKSISCWGSNTEGELGRGTTTTQELAAPVGGVDGVVSVSPGADHVCARTNDGSVYCWGSNKFGQVGDGTEESRLTPVKIAF